MEETTTNPHAVKCKFCGGEYTQKILVQHEAACEHRTPAQRAKTSSAREAYRQKYSVAANGGATARRYVERVKAQTGTPKFRKRPRKTLDTPVVDVEEERHQRKLERQRRYYAEHGPRARYRHSVANNPTAAKLAKAVSKAQFLLNGKRLQITLSLDWETVRDLIVQVAPDIAIDGITLI